MLSFSVSRALILRLIDGEGAFRIHAVVLVEPIYPTFYNFSGTFAQVEKSVYILNLFY